MFTAVCFCVAAAARRRGGGVDSFCVMPFGVLSVLIVSCDISSVAYVEVL